MLERLSYIDIVVTEGEGPTVKMGILFLRFLESLSAGVLIGPNSELSDLPDPIMASSGNGRLLDLMAPKDVVESSSAAQEALRLVTFRRIYEVARMRYLFDHFSSLLTPHRLFCSFGQLLDLPKFVPPCMISYLPPTGAETDGHRQSIHKRPRSEGTDPPREAKRSRRI